MPRSSFPQIAAPSPLTSPFPCTLPDDATRARHSLRQNLHPYLLTFLPPTSPSVPLPAFSLSFPVPFPPLVKFWEDTPHKVNQDEFGGGARVDREEARARGEVGRGDREEGAGEQGQEQAHPQNHPPTRRRL
ncbi:unnamed protein product [Closterium sp. NIES-53]